MADQSLVPVEIEIKPLTMHIGIDPASGDSVGSMVLVRATDDGQFVLLDITEARPPRHIRRQLSRPADLGNRQITIGDQGLNRAERRGKP